MVRKTKAMARAKKMTRRALRKEARRWMKAAQKKREMDQVTM